MEAPNLPNIFKGTRNGTRGSRYKPMYYDPDKEDLERRVAKIKKQYQNEQQDSELRKVFMEDRISNDPMRRKLRSNRKSQVMRLTFILAILIAITYSILHNLGFI